MGELVGRARSDCSAAHQEPQVGGESDGAKRQDGARAEQVDLLLEVGRAIAQLGGEGFVIGRRTAQRGGDVGVVKREPVSSVGDAMTCTGLAKPAR